MFGDIGAPELIIVLIIILLLFGPGRIGKVAGELGKGIRNFREGLSGKDEETTVKPEPCTRLYLMGARCIGCSAWRRGAAWARAASAAIGRWNWVR